MVIGVDAAVLSVSDERLKVGVYRYVLHALEELGKIDTKNSYRLYSFDPIDESLLTRFGARMENRVLWPVKGWSTIRLPLELSLHPVDLFLGMSQMIPKNAGTSIGFVYDLGYLSRKSSYPGSYEKLKKQTENIFNKSQKIVTISKSVADEIGTEYTFPKDAISVCSPGIDSRFTNTGVLHTDTYRYFLFVGALKPGKNVPGILRGFATFLQKSHRVFNLYLIGGNYWEDPEIHEVLRQYKLESRVKKLGFIPDEELPAYYRGATAAVLPSFHEGFCMPAAEALACGCPVITSKSPVMKEVLGKAGVFVNPEDPDEIARAMEDLSYNVKKRLDLSVEGISQAKQYTWQKLGKVLLHEIKSFSSK